MAGNYLTAKLETSGPVNEFTSSPTFSTKKVYFPAVSAAPDISPAQLTRDDELSSGNEPSPMIPDKFDPKMPIAVRGYPDTTAFAMCMLYGLPTTTAGNGTITDLGGGTIPVGAYRHVWTAPFGSGNVPQSSQVISAYKDESVWLQHDGYGVNQLDFSTDDTVMNLALTGDGLYTHRIADPSLTPAYETPSIQPWKPRNASLTTWLAATGATVQGGMGLTLTNPFEKDRTLGIVSLYPDALFKTDKPKTTGTMNKQLFDADDWDAMVASTGFAALVSWINDSIVTGSYRYKMFWSFTNLQYSGLTPDPLTNQRRLGASAQFQASDASGSGGSSIIQICNATASYS